MTQPRTVPDWFARTTADEPLREWIEVEGAAVELLTWGPRGAPGVLLLHGARAHADWWSHLAPLLADGRRVACLSWSGMGRSGRRERYSMDQYRREALAAAEAAGLFEADEKPVIVGHSFGGYVAAMIAAAEGERLGAAVIVDSSIRPTATRWPDIVAPRTYATFEEARARFRFAPAQPSLPCIADWFAAHALMEADGGWAWRFDPDIYSKLAFQNVWEALAAPRCPIAIVRGERSAVVTPALAALQADKAPPGTPYVVVPGAGHHLMADRPLALVKALRDLLARYSSKAT